MTKPICFNCEHWHYHSMECHRYPPQFVSDGKNRGFEFPKTGENNWCGEYKIAPQGVRDIRRDQLLLRQK